MKNWQMRIVDPSGETRTLPLAWGKPTTVGRFPTAGILLKDPTLPEYVAEISHLPDSDPSIPNFWFRLECDSRTAARLGDWQCEKLPCSRTFRFNSERRASF